MSLHPHYPIGLLRHSVLASDDMALSQRERVFNHRDPRPRTERVSLRSADRGFPCRRFGSLPCLWVPNRTIRECQVFARQSVSQLLIDRVGAGRRCARTAISRRRSSSQSNSLRCSGCNNQLMSPRRKSSRDASFCCGLKATNLQAVTLHQSFCPLLDLWQFTFDPLQDRLGFGRVISLRLHDGLVCLARNADHSIQARLG